MNYKIPKGQISWMVQYDENHIPKQLITSNEMRTQYFLYNIGDDGILTKFETTKEPIFKKDMFNKTK